MCGIAGTYGIPPIDVELMLDRIAHRGPDGRGTVVRDGAVHGHVRLAIQDPTPRSDQPFRHGDVTLTYVGECWNATDLRRELEAGGWEFVTTGDTEVIAAALDAWGIDALTRIDGMFTVAWTSAAGTYLARDRFGKVPLYFLPAGGGLLDSGSAWASERKAFGSRSAEAYAVPPGCRLDVSGDARAHRYYALPAGASAAEDAAERVRGMLERGVDRRMVADVPLCCLISGGMDSAAILEFVRRRRPDVVAYHAYLDPLSADLAASRRLCAELGVELREVHVPPPTDVDVITAVTTIEVPMKAQVEIALLCLPLARRIRADGFRVVLSGESADELFGGYGNLARHAQTDETWRAARRHAVTKMARGNFCRVNKVFMAHGVEGRLPFMERDLVELTLGLGVRDCPPGKRLLKDALEGVIPGWVIRRQKETFQGAGGTITACARLYPSPLKVYNEIARTTFGALPRD